MVAGSGICEPYVRPSTVGALFPKCLVKNRMITKTPLTEQKSDLYSNKRVRFKSWSIFSEAYSFMRRLKCKLKSAKIT